jgi:predicted PurR-regulated permease PerM
VTDGPMVDEPRAGSRGTAGSPTSTMTQPTETPATLVPEWLDNLASLSWRALAVAGLAVVLWFLATLLWTVTASVAVAIIVSAVFAPYVLRLRAGGRSRNAAALIVWATAILVIGGVLLLLGLAFLPYVVELATWIDSGLSELQAQLAALQVPDWVTTLARDAISAVRDSAGDTSGGIAAAAAQMVTIAILATFLVFFFLRDGDKAWLWMFQAIDEQKRDIVSTAGDDALARVGGYLRGTTVLAGLIAITDYVFMLLLGVPLALPLTVLVFLCGYIPYFGGIVTTVIILLVTLAALGPGPAIAILLLMGIRTAILGSFVRPLVYGRTVSIHPALVLVALPAGFELAGIIGLFAAVPVTAVVIAVAGAAITIVEPIPAPPLPALVPPWLDRVAQFSWRILVGVGLVALLVGILVTVPLVVIPIILAIILAATLEPLVGGLMARGHSRGRAAAIAVGGGFLLIAGVLALAFASLVEQADEVAAGAMSGIRSTSDALAGQLGLASDAVSTGSLEAVKAIASLVDEGAALVTIVVLSTLLAFYLLRDGGRLWARLVSRVPMDAEGQLRAAGERAFKVLGGYMIGTAAISFVGAASQWVIMVVLGLPLALPIFVLSFFLSFIPYIGGFISTGLAFLIAVAFGTPVDVLVMGIWTIVFNLVTGNIVAPLVYGRTVHIHPAIVLVAIPAGAAIAGILGMFVVVPALGVVAVTWRTVLSLMARQDPGGSADPSPVEVARTAPSEAMAPGSS